MRVKIGKGIELDVDIERLKDEPAVFDHVVYIGLRNILMDAHASVTEEDSTDYVEESKAASLKKLEAMYDGDIRSVSSRTTDPVESLALKLATDAVLEEWVAAGNKKKALDPKDLRRAARDAMEDYRELAEDTIEKKKALKKPGLAALGL